MINIIVAVGNYVVDKGFPIGKGGTMPWHSKADLKWFKDMTTGHPIIMGRKTFEAIGHPLKNRTNIVVTTRKEYDLKYNVKIANDLEEAINFAKTIDDEIFIIGGASLYEYALEHNLVDRVYIDMLAINVSDADTFFPDILTDNNWEEVGRPIEIENRKAYALTYVKCNGQNNHVDEQYLKLVNEIIEKGEIKDTRAGKTRSLFGKQLRFNLKEGLPILTTKKVYTKGVIHELLWFLKGDTNIKYLVDNNVHIWDDDAYRYFLTNFKGSGDNFEIGKDNIFLKEDENGGLLCKFDEDNNYSYVAKHKNITKEEFIKNVKNGVEWWYTGEDCPVFEKYKFGELGPVYGKQWTNWDGVNQVKQLIETLKTNPDDRRLIVSAWNVGEIKDMALPPCHYTAQFYTRKMTMEERQKWVIDNNFEFKLPDNYFQRNLEELFDEWGVPSRKLSCMWNQRSVDSLLGLPFNILSYSILTYLIAQCCNMDVDELIFSGGDCHVYENQIEAYENEQKNRNPHMYGLPKLVLNKEIKNIEDFTFDDIKIVGYESYPSVKYPLSVGL